MQHLDVPDFSLSTNTCLSKGHFSINYKNHRGSELISQTKSVMEASLIFFIRSISSESSILTSPKNIGKLFGFLVFWEKSKLGIENKCVRNIYLPRLHLKKAQDFLLWKILDKFRLRNMICHVREVTVKLTIKTTFREAKNFE